MRRDVYIRMAVFARALSRHPTFRNVYLVLPPFQQLYHWRITEERSLDEKDVKFWVDFFDIPSLRRYAQVLDLPEYFHLMKTCFGQAPKQPYILDHVFKLKHFESMFESGKFIEKYEVLEKCGSDESNRIGNQFTQIYSNVTVKQFHCVEFQGSAMMLGGLLKEYTNQ